MTMMLLVKKIAGLNTLLEKSGNKPRQPITLSQRHILPESATSLSSSFLAVFEAQFF